MRPLTRSTRVRIVSALVVSLAGLTFTGAIGPALARSGCANETAAGEYALQATGLTDGLSHTTTDLGRIVVDGRGRLSGQLTVSVNGHIAQGQTVAGTYSVQPDCTGAETFTVGADPTERHADFVLAENGGLISFLETDAGTVFSGTATRQ